VVCGTWFPVEPGVDARKARRKFCSAACKVADYRQRREQALALQAEGVPPRVIAERIDTDLATIREWLKKEGK
jgi:predicted RNA-binding protein Jag